MPGQSAWRGSDGEGRVMSTYTDRHLVVQLVELAHTLKRAGRLRQQTVCTVFVVLTATETVCWPIFSITQSLCNHPSRTK